MFLFYLYSFFALICFVGRNVLAKIYGNTDMMWYSYLAFAVGLLASLFSILAVARGPLSLHVLLVPPFQIILSALIAQWIFHEKMNSLQYVFALLIVLSVFGFLWAKNT